MASDRGYIFFKVIGSVCGSISFIMLMVAILTEGWWKSDNVTHGLWTATRNRNNEKINIGSSRGYRGLETVRGITC